MSSDLRVLQYPVLSDNYAYLAVCMRSRKVAVIDTPDIATVLTAIQREGLELTALFNTHHHWDHAGGNEELLEHSAISVHASSYDKDRIFGVTNTVADGQKVSVGELTFTVIDVPGHTLGHVAYYGHGVLFCGDTLFVGGCGRLFEGTAEQMHNSLQKITKLPPETLVYCAHEYTLQNLEFALSVNPSNADLKERYQQARAKREQNLPTVPTTIGEELKHNPFLRTQCQEIKDAVKKAGHNTKTPAAVFAGLRKMKDVMTAALLCLFLLVAPTTQAEEPLCQPQTASDWLKKAKTASELAQTATSLRYKSQWAQDGMQAAQNCLHLAPQNTACIYYRAINQGLELSTRTSKIKTGLKRMVKDFETVIEQDETYDNGGAHLGLGSVYLKAPGLPIFGKNLRRDLNKAWHHATKALRINSKNYDNLKFAAQVAYKRKDYQTAHKHFRQAAKQLKTLKHTKTYDKEKKYIKKWTKKSKKQKRTQI